MRPHMFNSATSERRPASITASSPWTRGPPVSDEQTLGAVGIVADGDPTMLVVLASARLVSPSREFAERGASPIPLAGGGCPRNSMIGWRATSAANNPPAAISGSCLGSPTNTNLAPVRSTSASRRARSRVPAVPASSTTSTLRCRGRRVRHGRWRSAVGRSWSTECRRRSRARRRRRRCGQPRTPGTRCVPTHHAPQRTRRSCPHRRAR